MGVETVRDLLFHLPRRYDDLRELRTLGDLRDADDGTVASAQVTRDRHRASSRRGGAGSRSRPRTLRDATGFATATWFGRRYIEKRLQRGDEILVSGKIKHRHGELVFEGPEFQPADAENLLHVGRIVPVYRLTTGLTANRLRGAMRVALDRAGDDYPEYLPRGDPRRRGRARRSARRSRPPTTRRRSRPATRRSAGSPSTSCSRSSWAWSSRRRARGRARTLAIAVDRRRRTRASATALEASLARKLGEPASLTADQATAIDEIAGGPRAAGARCCG